MSLQTGQHARYDHDQLRRAGTTLTGTVATLTDANSGGVPEDVQAGFASSPEITAQNGNTPQGWVTGLYEKILHRPPEQTGLDYWICQVEQLDAGRQIVRR